MAAGLLSYSGIVTKTKAMRSNLISPDEYEKMLNFGSVSELIGFLKEHPGYQEIFKDLDINIHRGEIEHELVHSLQPTYAKLYRFARVKQRKAIRILFYRFEVQVIKMCLQNLLIEDRSIDLSLFKTFFERHSSINIEMMAQANTIDALLEGLRDTDYYAVLKDVQNIPDPKIFDYETRLDVYYFEMLWKYKDKALSGKENKAYTAVIGQQIDLLNIMWIFRFKSFFDTDNGKIMQSIIPIHYRLTKKMVGQMVATENVADLSQLIKSGPYRRLFSEEMLSTEQIEKSYNHYLYSVYINEAKKNPNSIIPIKFFLYLKEREVDRLTSALECIRYKLSADESMKILDRL